MARTRWFQSAISCAGLTLLALVASFALAGPLRAHNTASVPPLARHDVDPLFAPACSTASLLSVSEAIDPRSSVAAFQSARQASGEEHHIGEEVRGLRIEFIGFNPIERSPAVWLSSRGELCQALLFPSKTAAPNVERAAASSGTIASKIRKLSDDEYDVERSALTQILESQADLMRSARIVPETRNGKVIGIRVYGIHAGDLLSLLGLQNADLLQSVNGVDLADQEATIALYMRLRSLSTLEVRLERKGAPIVLTLHIR